MELKFIDDLFDTEESMKRYKETLYPFNLTLVKEALDKKLEKDPEYEVFIRIFYYPFVLKLKDRLKTDALQPYGYFISNKGRVYSSYYKKIMKPGLNSSGYRQANIPMNGKQIGFAVHRAVGCVFIPLKDHHLAAGHLPKDLEVNHDDGNKENNDWSNLEWTTTSENQKHAVTNGLSKTGKDRAATKPLKGRVIRGNHIGYEFVVYGGNDLETYGFDQAACSNAANGKLKSHGNCKWSFATEEERKALPNTIPEEILKDIKETCPFSKYRTIGTNILTGEVVSFIGNTKCRELGFNPEAIRNMIAGRTASHKGYTWKYELLETEL